MVNLSASNGCRRCPEETNTPIFNQLVHERGYPQGEPEHTVEVLDGEATVTAS